MTPTRRDALLGGVHVVEQVDDAVRLAADRSVEYGTQPVDLPLVSRAEQDLAFRLLARAAGDGTNTTTSPASLVLT